jgi:zinc D-Ala-D-Ala carboxypeptidase
MLSEAQGAVLPLIALLDALRWMFIALALGGIGLPALPWMDNSRQGKV